jgi:catechol 2,3-dioxygenase-like lactoylglutathione lyase family enzyme
MRIDLVTIVVEDYDRAIAFFVDILGFDLAEDVPSPTNDGRPKRRVVVRSADGGTGIPLARDDEPHRRCRRIGPTAGRRCRHR